MAPTRRLDSLTMAMTGEQNSSKSHVAVFPSAGMGHFMPFLHFARTLATNHGFSVTFITTHTNVSPIETAHKDTLAASGLDIRVVRLDIKSRQGTKTAKEDPFLAHWDEVRESMAAFEKFLETDLLQQSWRRPISAIVTEQVLTPTLDITARFNVPNYVLFTAAAFTFGFMAHFPVLDSGGFDFGNETAIPGFPALPVTQIAQAFRIEGHIFRRIFLSTGSQIAKAAGVFLNTFEELEEECLRGLRSGHVARDLPPLFAIGPLFLTAGATTSDGDGEAQALRWLEAQPARSVVYVSFGSRSAMSEAQIAELALGLECSQQRFLWILRTSVVDGVASSDRGVLPVGFESRVDGRGLVVSSWVPQVKILSHVATGAFVSHCGWNSVIESISCEVPIVAWPLSGDQMMNTRIVVENAVGVEVKKSGDGIVTRDEVERGVNCVMERKELRRKARELGESGRMAVREGGSSYKSMMEAIQDWK